MASAAQQSLQGSKRSSDSLSTPTVRSMQPHVTNGIRREVRGGNKNVLTVFVVLGCYLSLHFCFCYLDTRNKQQEI